jgi:hypothetical protein
MKEQNLKEAERIVRSIYPSLKSFEVDDDGFLRVYLPSSVDYAQAVDMALKNQHLLDHLKLHLIPLI